MPVKLTKKQYTIIAIAAAVAATSLVIGLKYFSRAFPEATLRLRVDRSGSETIARNFLAGRGFHLSGYRHAAIFDYDDDTKLYLERTQGLARMDKLTSGPVHLWRWSHRWFKPQQKEEFSVEVTPDGQVVGFDHRVAEAMPGARLNQPQARAIAETFLTQVMKRNLSDMESEEAQRLKRPARIDYTFTWKRKSVHLGSGSLRVEVAVDGNQVAGYGEYVKIPQDWSRAYEQIRSHNDAAQEVDQVFWVLLSLAMLIILVRRLRDRDVPLRTALLLGGVAAVLEFLSRLNSFPLAEFSYRTKDSYSSFLANYALIAVMSALGIGTVIYLICAAAEPVYRESLPGLMSFRKYFSWKGLRTRSFFMANIVGVALTFFFFAYQTIFYLIANRLGAWAPSDIPFSNQLNTHIPWVAVLFTGFFPAVSEEMQFRAFAIPFLRRVTKSWPAAIILAAFNWGFLHAAYPNQPFFIRGVEVGLGGIIIGVVMLRFGIIATLMWHYSVDALYEAFLLLRSGNHYLMISGGLCAGVMLIPLVVALAAYLRTGTFAEEGPLSNASEGILRAAASAPAEAGLPVIYQPLSKRRLLAALAVAVVFAGLAFIKADHLGKGIKVGTTRTGAISIAQSYLSARNVKPAEYHSAAWLDENVNPLALRYFLDRLTVRQTNRLIRETAQPLLWEVRFYRPLEEEEYLVFVNATNGTVYSVQHLLPETAPGATLTPAQALALGEQTVARHGYQLSTFVLQDSVAQKRPAREDYELVWQAKPGDPRNVGKAYYRLQADIAGNQVAGFARSFKLPEDWVRRHEKSSLAGTLLQGSALVLGIGFIAGAIWLFVLRVKEGAVRWTAALKAALALTALSALFELNSIPAIARAYDTSISLSNFRLQIAVSTIVVVILAGALMWLLVALAAGLYPQSWDLLRGASRRVWRRDAAVAAAVTLAAGAGLDKLIALLTSRFHAWAPVRFPGAPSGLGTYLPSAGIFLQALLASIISSAILAIAIYIVLAGWRRRAAWFWAGGVLLGAALIPWGVHSRPGLLLGWAMRFVPLLVAALIVILFFRGNPLAYVTAAFCSAVAAPIVSLLTAPVSFYRLNGVLLAALSAIALAWLLLPGMAPSRAK